MTIPTTAWGALGWSRRAEAKCLEWALEPRGAGFYFPLPQIDIAAYLAVTPETVCRSLKQLRKLEIIDMPSHDRLIIANRSRLEHAAHGFPV